MRIVLIVTLLALTYGQVAAANERLVNIVDSYDFDQASLLYHPAYEERVRVLYAGRPYYEHVPRPESWSFAIIRAGRRIPCTIICTERGDPDFIQGENMPMGVIRYLQANICDRKEDFR